MKIYRKKISPIAESIVDTLARDGDIEIMGSLHNTVVRDIARFIEEYVEQEQSLANTAREIIERKGLSESQFGKVRDILAEEKGIPLGDDAMEYLADRIIRYMLTEDSIDEVYSEDTDMRKKIFDVFNRHIDVEEDIDREVRARLKNIPENSPIFKIEYEKVLREVKRKKGLL